MKNLEEAFDYIPPKYPKDGEFSGFVAKMVQGIIKEKKVAETQNKEVTEEKDIFWEALKGFGDRNK